MDGKTVEQVEIFKYLGRNVHEENKEEPDINERIENMTKL